MANILVVEDEAAIREVMAGYLERSGYSVSSAADGRAALNLWQSKPFDLVLLDLNLPITDGITVCKQIRQKSLVPIIMVTARSEEWDEVVGLEVGADDYIKKPFSPQVLVARVQALLRRVGSGPLQIADLRIDPDKMQVLQQDKELILTTTQFNVLYLLASQPGRVFTRDQILDRSHNDPADIYVLERTVDAHIKSIRKILDDDPKQPRYILTVIGKGYKFNEQA